jgi:hypothetical protein
MLNIHIFRITSVFIIALFVITGCSITDEAEETEDVGTSSTVTKIVQASESDEASTLIQNECEDKGGVALYHGIDSNQNGELEQSEYSVNSPLIICNGESGNSSLIKTEELDSNSSECPNGGIKVISGLDLDNNSTLDDSEITTEKIICNGETQIISGDDSNITVINGLNSITRTETASNAVCPNNGTILLIGLDSNKNSYLDDSEIEQNISICNAENGTNGIDGQDGNNSLELIEIQEANNSCSNNGISVLFGLDINQNSILDINEIEQNKTICNGENGIDGNDGADGNNGLNSISEIQNLDNNETNCSNGGVRIVTGIDLNSDGTLSFNEINSSADICNGENGLDGSDGVDGISSNGIDGSDGADGNNGLNSLVIFETDSNNSCSNGGYFIHSGLDINLNGTLDQNEINSTVTVCNGENGTDGTDGQDGIDGNTTIINTNDDTTSPTVLDINLSESNITINFSEPMDSLSIDKSTILVDNQTSYLLGRIEEINSSKFAFIPKNQNFSSDVNYTIFVSALISDLAGNKLDNYFETTLSLGSNSTVSNDSNISSNLDFFNTYNSSENNGYGIYKINDHNSSFSYELILGNETKDVYIVFTNPTENNFTTASSVSEISLTSSNVILAPISNQIILNNDSDSNINNQQESEKLREIRLANQNPFEYFGIEPILKTDTEANNDILFNSIDTSPTYDSVGDTQNFYDDGGSLVASTCRKVVSNEHNRTLSIWVANNSWDTGCSKAYCVTQSMVDAFADKFLNSSVDNIFKYETSFLGDEWGKTPYSNHIDFNNQITILMFDIDSDNSTNGGTAGFFYSRDNFKQSYIATSNERIMFYIDSVFVANDGGDGTWDIIDDYWPSSLVSTLAHEFQHMIHYFQKNISRAGSSADTWINEMMAQTTEDILDTKLQSGGSLSRISGFNEFYYIPLTDWYSGTFNTGTEVDVLNSYSVSYLFGAYLIRNYGGVEVMQNIMFNNETDHSAVEYAISQNNSDDANFSKLLQNWGVASVLSDKTDAPQPYSYNSDSNVTFNNMNYDLKAINLFSYQQKESGTNGPKIFDKDNLPSGNYAGKSKYSNMFYKVGENLTGNVKIQINTDSDSLITVIAK